jgi:hypothetical protein
MEDIRFLKKQKNAASSRSGLPPAARRVWAKSGGEIIAMLIENWN